MGGGRAVRAGAQEIPKLMELYYETIIEKIKKNSQGKNKTAAVWRQNKGHRKGPNTKLQEDCP